MNPFTARPASIGDGHLRRLRLACRFGASMTAGGRAAPVHAILPLCLVTMASRVGGELVAMRAASRGRTLRVVDAATMQPLDYHL